jgi:SPP1 family predicted phage head-tail adaptor
MGELELRMKAGPARHRVEFLRRKPGLDALGQQYVEFVRLFECWAQVGPVNGREFFNAEHHVDRVDSQIVIRYLPHQQLTAHDIAKVTSPQGGRYDLQTVMEPDMARKTITILAKRVT